MRYVAANFRVAGLAVVAQGCVPAILPFYVTGAITARAGHGKRRIVAELGDWGQTEVKARGLGSYIGGGDDRRGLSSHHLGDRHDELFVVVINSCSGVPCITTRTQISTHLTGRP